MRLALFALCHSQLYQLARQQHRVIQADEGRGQKQGHILEATALVVGGFTEWGHDGMECINAPAKRSDQGHPSDGCRAPIPAEVPVSVNDLGWCMSYIGIFLWSNSSTSYVNVGGASQ